MNKRYILSSLLLFIGGQLSAQEVSGQETAAPVVNKTNRIILHYKDTTGLFTALARILIDRGHDIEYKDREFGLLRTKPGTIPGGDSYNERMEVKTVFRDSTITISSAVHSLTCFHDSFYESQYELMFTKNRKNITNLPWNELMLIAGLLKPESLTYQTVVTLKPYTPFNGYVKPPK
jgi:hypothetical protein